ncbi:hypothetical protein [Bacillus sp. NEB1478]|uniref:hypothetical protein n=1 Tax=Bacillus sp. NEB1478 TaxID=3073816 RepID=UPI002873C515|nr:hypothetical protein [Bacillus sp. NEB1478]WNB93257.1 hypothetical protein RGB74_06190 [Bacillus sp. NEB1478]
MGIINLLENEYELYGVRWKEEPHVIFTDFGDKRLRYWSEEQLLEWHVKWRDESSKGSSAVPDRMIRTRDGGNAVFDGKHWVTLHDTADIPFGCEEVGRWGQFIGHLLAASIKYENVPCTIDGEPALDYEKCLEKLELYAEGNFHSLNISIAEAKKRIHFAEVLYKKTVRTPRPILEKEISIINGKRIFHFLFYEGGDSKPIRGYLPIRNFMLEWLLQTSPLSMKMLLDEIHSVFSLSDDQGLLLLAEITMPWELKDCINFLDNSSLEKMVDGMNKYEKLWEDNRLLLKTVTEWYEDTRRKVAL